MRFAILILLGGCSSGLQVVPIEDTFAPDDHLPDDTDAEPLDTDEAALGENGAPVADAGDDVGALVTDVVQLDGSASYDPDADGLTFSWEMVSQPSTSNAYLINETRPNPSFFVDAPGEYVIELVVDDGELSDVDEVVVEATSPNSGPVANAGPDQTADVGDTVQLNGSGSYDPETDDIDYSWTITSKPAGSAAALDNPGSVLPRFTADVAGAYVIQLAVTDDGGATWSPPDEMRVTATEPSDSDCISCAQAQMELDRRVRAGDVASGFGLALLPVFALLLGRRRDD